MILLHLPICSKAKDNKKNFSFIFLAVLLFMWFHGFAQSSIILKSPQAKIKAHLLIKNGSLHYKISSANNKVLIEPSLLGLVYDNNKILGTYTSSITIAKTSHLNTIDKIKGKHEEAHNNYKEYTIQVKDSTEQYILKIRMFDNGFAYRYELNNISPHTIQEEFSSFTLPAKTKIWFTERKNEWKLKSYAGEWISADIDSMVHISPTGPIQGKPLIAELKNGYYLLLTEAALYNYSGLRFEAIGNRTFKANFTEGNEGFSMNVQKQTPWRVIVCAPNLNELINNDVIYNLNPLPDKSYYNNTSYIKEGRSVWSWLTRDTSYLEPEKEKEFIDYAFNLKFEYTLIDEGWEKSWNNKWKQLKELCNYAKTKNVGVWVWKHSHEIKNVAVCNNFLDSIAAAGVVGIKVDFINSEAKEWIDFEVELLKACAQRKLMVNFHGCHPPTGESKTFPNELTREGIRGLELNLMKEGPISASHNAALPFTRFAIGHGDYTPALFSNPGITTWGQQLATLYLFDSQFMCLAENPNYIFQNKNLQQIIPYLQSLPVTWNETIALEGCKIGAFVAFARRKETTWYIIFLNGESKIKKYILHPTFLTTNNRYIAESINDADGETKKLIKKKEGSLTNKSAILITIQPNGGAVIKITNKNKSE
jgi:alpha-glucosidase